MSRLIAHALLLLAISQGSLAQTQVQKQTPVPTLSPSAANASASGDETQAVVVTANPLGSSSLFDLAAPASALSGQGLMLRRESTLGETLGTQPGVSSSGYGPNASRPVIRGLDGDRVRILQNGVGSFDASAASPDHAVAMDPLAADRIEVVRGPAALLYGGSAVGGVVNVIDSRIAREPIRGISSMLDARLGGPSSETSSSLRLDGGNGGFALHMDAHTRRTENQYIPGDAVSARKRAQSNNAVSSFLLNASGRQPNSASVTDGGGLGFSMTGDKGYLGLSTSALNNVYGTVSEQDVRIRMQQNRWDLAGEVRELNGPFNAVKLKLGSTDYEHQEWSGDVLGTTFSNSGLDGRLELLHQPIGVFSGAIGLQTTRGNSSAIGAEAFIPAGQSRAMALFLYEEASIGRWKWSMGGRAERNTVKVDAFDVAGTAADEKRFNARSASLGTVYGLSKGWGLAVNAAYTERAPTQVELFANGPHVATSAFEIGSSSLGLERSRAIDIGFRKSEGVLTGNAGLFYNRFANYVFLAPTTDSSGNALYRNKDSRNDAALTYSAASAAGYSAMQQYQFTAVPAVFKGFEVQGRWQAWQRSGRQLDLMLRGDYTRASNADTGVALPRIPAMRIGLGLQYRDGPLMAQLDAVRTSAQDKLYTSELRTDGNTLVHASINYRLRAPSGDASGSTWEAYLKANNLFDREARNHSSFLKDIAPLPGRGLMLGLRGSF